MGKILQDEQGYFYRPGTAGGLHKPGKDGDHMPSIKAVMASLNGDDSGQGEPVTTAKSQAKPVTASKPAKAAKVVKAPSGKKPGSSTPVGKDPVAINKLQEQVIQSLQKIEERRELATAEVPVTKVRYKLVEQLSIVGTHYWLYVGYEWPQGFKWQSMAVGMFRSVEDVEQFITLNGITLDPTREQVDVRNGSYSPNKGLIRHDSKGQQILL